MRNLVAAALCVLAAPLSAAGLDVTVKGGGANGTFHIELFDDVAPGHVKQITALAEQGAYDGIVFHRVDGKKLRRQIGQAFFRRARHGDPFFGIAGFLPG